METLDSWVGPKHIINNREQNCIFTVPIIVSEWRIKMRLKLDNNFKLFSSSNKLILSSIIDFYEFTFTTKLVLYIFFFFTELTIF